MDFPQGIREEPDQRAVSARPKNPRRNGGFLSFTIDFIGFLRALLRLVISTAGACFGTESMRKGNMNHAPCASQRSRTTAGNLLAIGWAAQPTGATLAVAPCPPKTSRSPALYRDRHGPNGLSAVSNSNRFSCHPFAETSLGMRNLPRARYREANSSPKFSH
jgi:hypothetical protein